MKVSSGAGLENARVAGDDKGPLPTSYAQAGRTADAIAIEERLLSTRNRSWG